MPTLSLVAVCSPIANPLTLKGLIRRTTSTESLNLGAQQTIYHVPSLLLWDQISDNLSSLSPKPLIFTSEVNLSTAPVLDVLSSGCFSSIAPERILTIVDYMTLLWDAAVYKPCTCKGSHYLSLSHISIALDLEEVQRSENDQESVWAGSKRGRKVWERPRTVLQVAGGDSTRRSWCTPRRLLHSHSDLLPEGNGP